MKTAVIYARYSSDSQSEQSIEGQLRVCEEYAKANNILILDTYIDRAMTGTNDNREDFQRMLKDSENATWDIVLIYAIDRFGRNSIEVAINKQRLKTNGKVLISATQRTSDNIDGTKNLDGILLENVYIGIAEYYSAELSQKVKRGMKETRRKGLYQGGGLPYGYKVIDRKIVVDEEKAEVINYMYEQYSIGVYVSKIINTLTAKGILHKGKPFTPNTVYGILANERYSGIYRHDNEVYDNMFPAIVPAEIYKKVRAIVEKNKVGKRSVKTVYLLRHKLRCGLCGEPISAETGTARNGEVIHYYKCIGRKKRKNDCQKVPVKKEELENLIITKVVEKLSDNKTMDYIVKGLLSTQDYQLKLNSSLNNLIRAKTNTQTALDNVMTAIEQGIISNTTNKRLHELEKKLENLERQILIERSKITVKYTADDIRNYYKNMLEANPELIINYAVKEVILYDDKIEIKLNNPLRNSPDDSRGFSFCQETVYLHKNKLTMIMCV